MPQLLDNGRLTAPAFWSCATEIDAEHKQLLRVSLAVPTALLDCAVCGVVWRRSVSEPPFFAGFAVEQPAVEELETWLEYVCDRGDAHREGLRVCEI